MSKILWYGILLLNILRYKIISSIFVDYPLYAEVTVKVSGKYHGIKVCSTSEQKLSSSSFILLKMFQVLALKYYNLSR